MNKLNSTLLILLISLSASASSEEIYLNCIGSKEVNQMPSGKSDTTQAKAFFKIDTDTNIFTISDYPLISTILDPNKKELRFISSESQFEFIHGFKNSNQDSLSSVKINRYTGKLNIYEAMTNQGGLMIVNSNMDCSTATKRKF